MASNEENIFDTIDEVVGTTGEITSTVQQSTYVNLEDAIKSAGLEGVYDANDRVEVAIAKVITEQIDEEELDKTTKDLSEHVGSATDMLNQVEGATNSILGQVDSTLNVAGQIALSNIDAATRLTMSAQDVLRMSFDEIEEKLKKAAIEYSKQRALGIAHTEFQEQLNLYYQAKDLYDRITGLKETAESVVTTAKNTIITTKNTISRVKSSLITLQKALKLAIDLATLI